MQQGGKLYSQFPAGMNADAALNFLANYSCHPCLTQASPESGIQQNDVNDSGSNAGCKLLEIDHYGVRRSRNFHKMANPVHAFEAPARIFVIVVANLLDGATNANGFLDAP